MTKRSSTASARRLQRKVVELNIAAPQVMGNRVGRMLLPGASERKADQRETERMVTEKSQALNEAWMGIASAAVNVQHEWLKLCANAAWSGWMPRSRAASMDGLQTALYRWMEAAVSPYHRLATANASRLSKRPYF